MGVINYRVATEVRKAVRGMDTKVPMADLFNWIAKDWLAMRKAGHSRAVAKVTHISSDLDPGRDELERMFHLEDSRDGDRN